MFLFFVFLLTKRQTSTHSNGLKAKVLQRMFANLLPGLKIKFPWLVSFQLAESVNCTNSIDIFRNRSANHIYFIDWTWSGSEKKSWLRQSSFTIPAFYLAIVLNHCTLCLMSQIETHSSPQPKNGLPQQSSIMGLLMRNYYFNYVMSGRPCSCQDTTNRASEWSLWDSHLKMRRYQSFWNLLFELILAHASSFLVRAEQSRKISWSIGVVRKNYSFSQYKSLQTSTKWKLHPKELAKHRFRPFTKPGL